jgi:hypothetical protein
MKTPLSIVLAASFALSGCAIFQRSPTWDSVVSSRAHYTEDAAGGKSGYLQYLHQVLSGAGVEHKVVTYQFHFLNTFHEEAIETATAIVYRDETTPRHPWWIMDENHNVPVWLPNWALDAQIEFFIHHKAEVVTSREYASRGPAQTRFAAADGKSPRSLIAHTPKAPKTRALFASSTTQPRTRRSAAPAEREPLSASVATADSRATALFRTAHGTAFDPGSSIDRQKMNELRRQLLSRGQKVRLRPE